MVRANARLAAAKRVGDGSAIRLKLKDETSSDKSVKE